MAGDCLTDFFFLFLSNVLMYYIYTMLPSLEQSNATSTHIMSDPDRFLVDLWSDWSDPGSITTLVEHKSIELFQWLGLQIPVCCKWQPLLQLLILHT